MANLLGGGGGKDGFRHLLEHTGPAATEWRNDMETNKYIGSAEAVAKLDASVKQWLEHTDPQVVKKISFTFPHRRRRRGWLQRPTCFRRAIYAAAAKPQQTN
jgi:hypothetical protein